MDVLRHAPTISTVQKRGYVVKEDRDGVKRNFDVILLKNNNIEATVETMNTEQNAPNYFLPTLELWLPSSSANFDEIMDYNFTALVEKEFDEIAEGKLKWQKMLESFYKPFTFM